MNPGSYEYKKLFCNSFIDSHLQHSSELWPALDTLSLAQLQSLPLWSYGVRQQSITAQITQSFAQTVKDPMVKTAIALQAEEQVRWVADFQAFLQTYQIPALSQRAVNLPKNLETAFIEAGYRTALDLLLANGLLAAAQQAHFLPEVVGLVFERALTEQTRHTVFLVNWMAYQEAKLGKRWSALRAIPALWQRSSAMIQTVAMFGKKDADDCSSTTQWMMRWTPESFLNLCRTEQERRLRDFAPDLLRPQFSSTVAKVACEALKVWPQRKASPTLNMLKP